MKIIGGGQTGADRAALDFALDNNMETGGWCPKGRIAEDGKIPEKYVLKETGSEEYSKRTRLNILDSDGTLIFVDDAIDDGTKLTLDLADDFNKPLFLVNLASFNNPRRLVEWLKNHSIQTLNIAGPRESNSPGIYDKVYDFLTKNNKLFGLELDKAV